MKIFLDDNVVEAAKKRVSFLFDEFETIVVSFSGGKDSTVIFDLCMKEATKRGRLPLNLLWVDQEAEWKGTVDFVEKLMRRDDVKPYWFQMPMVITNNASNFERFSYCWDEKQKDKWTHPQVDISIKQNTYGTDRFHELFGAIIAKEFPNQKVCSVGGVRTEETPKRFVGLTARATYKGVTWGKKERKDQYVFYPIYDWSYTDVWKYIHDNKLEYNRIYDEMYRMGVSTTNMRISNVHHETAIQALLLIQEIEPETWNKVSVKIDGVNAIKHLKGEAFRCPKELPHMFSSWEEYMNYLIHKLVDSDENKKLLYKNIYGGSEKTNLTFYSKNEELRDRYCREIINTVLSSDWDLTKLKNFLIRPDVYAYRLYHTQRREKWNYSPSCYKYLSEDEVNEIKEYVYNKRTIATN